MGIYIRVKEDITLGIKLKSLTLSQHYKICSLITYGDLVCHPRCSLCNILHSGKTWLVKGYIICRSDGTIFLLKPKHM